MHKNKYSEGDTNTTTGCDAADSNMECEGRPESEKSKDGKYKYTLTWGRVLKPS